MKSLKTLLAKDPNDVYARAYGIIYVKIAQSNCQDVNITSLGANNLNLRGGGGGRSWELLFD